MRGSRRNLCRNFLSDIQHLVIYACPVVFEYDSLDVIARGYGRGRRTPEEKDVVLRDEHRGAREDARIVGDLLAADGDGLHRRWCSLEIASESRRCLLGEGRVPIGV